MAPISNDVWLAKGLFRREVEAWAITAHTLIADREVSPRHPFEVNIPHESPLRQIARNRDLVSCMLRVIPNAQGIALYNERLVVKDAKASGPVFLHQDSPYHQGFGPKWSAFVALTASNADNGGQIVYPNTGKFGSLGDAGEINRDVLAGESPIPYCPDMAPGDVLFVQSHVWHESGPNGSTPRILVDIIFQSSGDPTGKELLSGYWRNTVSYTDDLRRRPHVNSRAQRIARLEEENKRLSLSLQIQSLRIGSEEG